ncbi:hypothetical protein M758_7G056100 [Ceratodon purpureus]|nr:hypothetical protein M758_7G056100 [Ceratodon purpureus]
MEQPSLVALLYSFSFMAPSFEYFHCVDLLELSCPRVRG